MRVKRKTKLMQVLGIIAVAGVISSVCFDAERVSAYSASLTTSSSVAIDAMVSNDGTTIQSESINVQSDCRNGYNLTIATPEGSNLYRYDNGFQSSTTASFTAVDGTSALNSNNNTNKWGYTLTSNPTSSTIFSPLSSTASVLKTPSQTASTTDINDTFNINYGIKIDNSVAPGTYQMANNGTVVYYLTMDTTCTQYTVNFNANGGTGSMDNQTIESGDSVKLTSSDSLTAPTGASYTDAGNNTITGDANKVWTFWGWNTAIDGTGDWYKDRESVADLTGAGSTITLYAQWKQPTLADLTTSTPSGDEKTIDHNEMQDMSPAACYNSPITTAENAPAATLIDTRGKVMTGDSPEAAESYTVSKLADNNCWMTKNLNLGRASGGPNGDGTVTLTSDDTDLEDNATFTLPVADTTSYTSTTRLPKVRLTNTGDTSANGAYYTWSAAVANTTSTTANISTSICPKNWDLPTRIQYTNLSSKSAYGTSNPTTAQPSNFLVDGGFTNGSSFYQLSYSHFWTNTSSSTTAAYGARVNSTTMSVSASTSTTYGGNKYYRKNVRCVANNGKATINYNGNGTTEYPVTGSVASQENVSIDDTTTTQSGTGFTRTSWTFNGWNTAADGSGTAVAVGDSITLLNPKPGSTITLYAQWLPQYKITYVDNCKSWASSDTNCTDTKSATTSEQMINLTNNPSTGTETGTLGAYNKFTMTGWKIKEWTTNADGTGTAYPVASTYTVPAGSGAGSGITLYAHWVPIYTVQYDGNGADNSSTGMGSTDPSTGIKTVNHTNVGEGDTFDLFASNFKRTGYGFVGWSTDSNAWSKLTDNDTTNDAKIWGPNEIITAPASNGTPITTLYAIWAPAETDGGNPVYLQNWTGCSSMTATTYDTTTGKLTVSKNSITALTDERDGNVYTIAKLADENCWMVENLRLADTHEENGNTVATTLTNANTNISATNNTLPITNIYNADSSLATKSNSLSPSSSVAYNADSAPYGWCNTNSAACNDQSRLNTTNSTWNNNTASAVTPSITQSITSANAHSDFNNYVYSYGNYYNWYSATAGYGTYSRSTSQPTDGDLCPAGWKLPYGGTGTSGGNIGGTKGGFSFLDKQMGGTGSSQATSVASNKWRTFPNNFIYSGYWNGGSASRLGSRSSYWSASANGNNYAYNLFFPNTYYVYPGDYGDGKYLGGSVRCVAGTYTPANTVTYMPNGSDVEGTMANQTISSTATSIDLYPSNFSRAGYGFAGWNTKPDGTGTNYGPMETISITAGQYNVEGLRLYANWIESEGSLQNWNGCSAMNQGDVTALTDQRDNDTYAVAKLADGKCWMIENLRLDNTNSDNSTGALAQGYNSSFIGLAEPEAPWANNSTDANSLYTTETGVSGKQTISGDNIGYRFPRYNNQNTSSRADTTTTDTNIYSYGNYYSWPAAIADTTEHDSDNQSVENISICPKGWHLPKGGSKSNEANNEFWSLIVTGLNNGTNPANYESSTQPYYTGNPEGNDASKLVRAYPNNFVYSGYVYSGSVSSRGSYGFYWSSTAYSSVNAYYLGFGSSYVFPGTGHNSKYLGWAIRCVAGS